MHRIKRLSILVAISLLLSAVAIAPTSAGTVQAYWPSTSIVYNLYATDAFIPLADGSAVYNYGFVGGRQGVKPFVYQKSVALVTGNPRDADTGLPLTFTYKGNGSIANGVPAPTGGPVTGDEALLQGNAQFPAPLIYAAVGDVVEIRLKNLGTTDPKAPNDPHSIHLHGLDVDAANDGVPETSIGAIPANLCDNGLTDLVAPIDCIGVAAPNAVPPILPSTGFAPGAGNVVVYMFSPKYPGTTMWHCHQEADIHVQMGMYGALVVYSALDKLNPNSAYNHGGPGNGYGGTLWGWQYDKDYVLMESEIGAEQHVSEEISGDYNPVNYHPQYWFLNGLSFPNTIHVGLPVQQPTDDGWKNWIAAHPGYDPFITGSIGKRWGRGEKVLIRMINMGYETQPMHMHGYHGKVLGSDQRAWDWANPPGTPFGKGEEKNTLTIGSGETYEWLVDFGQQALASTYPPRSAGVPPSQFAGGTQTRYNSNGSPASNTQTGLPAIQNPDGVDYIGGPQVTGANANIPIPTVGQLFPFHNHDDYKATNNGAYPGGMFTMLMPLP